MPGVVETTGQLPSEIMHETLETDLYATESLSTY